MADDKEDKKAAEDKAKKEAADKEAAKKAADDEAKRKAKEEEDKEKAMKLSADAKAQGLSEGRAEMQARFNAVMKHEASKGRNELAMTLLGTELSVEQIVAALEKAPVPAAAASSETEKGQQDTQKELALFGNAKSAPMSADFSKLYAAGEEAAKLLLGKTDKAA